MISGDGVANTTASLTATNFVGVAGSEAKNTIDYTDQNGGGQYTPNQETSVITRGSVTVICPNDAPVRYGAVYIRTVAATGRNIGDFESVSDTGNNVLVPNAQWGGKKDARNVAELVLLTRATA
jgi:hypothetical protein